MLSSVARCEICEVRESFAVRDSVKLYSLIKHKSSINRIQGEYFLASLHFLKEW